VARLASRPLRLAAPVGVATISSGPVPAIPASLAGGASGIYTWTVNAVTAGTADFTATVSGVDAITAGARTMDGIKFRTRAQSGRCHGSFCTTRLMKILSEETKTPLTAITKRGKGSEIVKGERTID